MADMMDTLKSGGKWTMHHDDVPRGGKEWWTMDVEIDGADYAAVLCQGPYLVNAILGWKARAARADKLEAELKYIFDLMGGYLGSDLVPLPKERDVDHEDLWLSLDEAGFGKIVISPEFMRLRIIDALGDAAPSSEGDDVSSSEN